MEKFGDIIVPIIIFAIVIINLIVKFAKAFAAKNNPPPVRRQVPPPAPGRTPAPMARDNWEDLLEALGQKGTNDENKRYDKQPARPVVFTPPLAKPKPKSAIPPQPIPAAEPEFVRVSDYKSRSLSDIGHSEFEVNREVDKKFTDTAPSRYVVKESNISSANVPAITTDHRTVHPIRAKFHSRQSIREAIIMSEILGSPVTMKG
jgi:hypothetical protein